MDKRKLIITIEVSTLGFIVLILLVLLCNTSYALLSNSLSDRVKIDESTSRYLSFNYTENVSSTFKNDDLKVISDDKGKKLSGDSVFDFSVSISEKHVEDDSVEYEVIAVLLDDFLNEKYVKFYMTDQNDNALENFEGTVPNLLSFPNSVSGKVVYSGMLSKGNLCDEYRVRVWINDKYDSLDINRSLKFRILVRLKDR